MWEDSIEALSPLDLPTREHVLDVGCGSGELSRVLKRETAGTVIGCDADLTLLAHAVESVPVVGGDATRLPFPDDTFDLVVCQALLINLPDPVAAIREFARISSDLVAAIEPDNGEVAVDSSVDVEATLERRARRAYLNGIATDATLGKDARDAFVNAGVEWLQTRRYDHDRTTAPPYDERALAVARRKATGAGLDDDSETILEEFSENEYDALRSAWRSMGRSVVEQMQTGEYHRTETVPFYVTVGRV